MRRESKHGTNKSIRFYQNLHHKSLRYYLYGDSSLDKRNRWKLIDLLKGHSQSSNGVNKIVVRRNCNFYQYNGYRHELTENIPKHRSFAYKPSFVYQPYAKFIKVNQDIFTIALQEGFKFLKNENNLRQLLDISSLDLSLTLNYFLDESKYGYSSDWSNAKRHVFGGYLGDYHMRCTAEYCPYGPKIRGQQTVDSRIYQVLLYIAKNR